EVIERILAYHPVLPDYHGCDDFKCGNPEDECTGVVSAMAATVNVVKKAVECGANLIVVHEPTNYTSMDRAGWTEDFPNEVYAEKERIMKEHGIAVWRDHDHMHFHDPDGIFTGVLKYMGWQEYASVDRSMGMFAHFLVELPEAVTLGKLMKDLRRTIGTSGIRYIGREDMTVKKLAVVGHLYPMPSREKNKAGDPKEYSVEIIRYFEEQNVDVILPGETIDWTVLSYVRDAVQLGQNKAVITLGHFNWEELGMRYTAEWLSELLDGALKVSYVPTEDMFSYMV
ncbi:MAG: Nif3-like dinuclear metal center hexameric protein, partial [Oscillospiraceae bacterium]|nr:Nif3-like dinuclear metal center hexameric protein [Oscillospiraceae bacterium]